MSGQRSALPITPDSISSDTEPGSLNWVPPPGCPNQGAVVPISTVSGFLRRYALNGFDSDPHGNNQQFTTIGGLRGDPRGAVARLVIEVGVGVAGGVERLLSIERITGRARGTWSWLHFIAHWAASPRWSETEGIFLSKPAPVRRSIELATLRERTTSPRLQ